MTPVNLETDNQHRHLKLKLVIAKSKGNFQRALHKFKIHKQLSSEMIEYKESQQNEEEAEQLLS